MKTERSGAPPGRTAPVKRAAAESVARRPVAGPARPAAGTSGFGRAFLSVPLFYKILIANALIVLCGAVAGTLITAQFVRAAPTHSVLELVAPFALVGLVLSGTINALILRLALTPVKQLGDTATHVRNGDHDARAPESPVADRELTRLIRLFNGMLDSLAAYRTRLQDMAARALQAEEMERKRVARELHDDTAQRLAALLIRLRVVRGMTDPALRDAALEDARRDISEALEGVRRYARGLRPTALDELGLVPAIETHAQMLREATGLSISVAADRLNGVLAADAELALYRMVQEALSNVVRHAHAASAEVRVERGDDDVILTVEDDGRGFRVDEVSQTEGRGLGLFGMRERAAYVGGQVAIESEPGGGTRVSIRVPIAEGEEIG